LRLSGLRGGVALHSSELTFKRDHAIFELANPLLHRGRVCGGRIGGGCLSKGGACQNPPECGCCKDCSFHSELLIIVING
jgi:hypothetical protein